METVTDFIFLGFKIPVDGDCSHEIKVLSYVILEQKKSKALPLELRLQAWIKDVLCSN